MQETAPRASVVVPAHDEETVIGDLLDALASADPGELEVVVVCNGCTDGTAAVAARHPWVRVVEIPECSKIAALNAGDRVATAFPRVYLDADVHIDVPALRAVVAALEAGEVAAAPLPRFDTRGAGPGSRLYHALRTELGYTRLALLGAGVYALSESGRARFGEFPDVIADDGFVYSLFARHERANPPGATFTIRVPRDLRSVYRRQVRISRGNLELAALGRRPDVPGPAWHQALRARPLLAPAAAVYVAVNTAARLRARHLSSSGRPVVWSRDESSR